MDIDTSGPFWKSDGSGKPDREAILATLKAVSERPPQLVSDKIVIHPKDAEKLKEMGLL